MENSQQPILSICIPTYNRAELLREQLRSLQAALPYVPVGSCEVVIRNNASTDHTLNVIEEFKELLPIHVLSNKENIGAARNILSLPLDACGKYIWFLGDDDLVMPNALECILKALNKYKEIDGCVVCYSVEKDCDRDVFQEKLRNKSIDCFSNPVIKVNAFAVSYLNRFESFFDIVENPIAMNFISFVIVMREQWLKASRKYIVHCENSEEYSDSITVFPHVFIWFEVLTGKPVTIISNPILMGFVGRQEIISSWPTIKFIFLLDISLFLVKLDIDKKYVQFYQRGIYSDYATLSGLIISEDAYTKKYFSLNSIIKKYGKDEALWKSLLKALRFTNGTCSKFKFAFNLVVSAIKNPRVWATSIKFMLKHSPKIISYSFKLISIKLRSLIPYSNKKLSYNDKLALMNLEAKNHFINVVSVGGNIVVRHPVYLMNPKYITVGSDFRAGPGLRMEAWDSYQGIDFSPVIKIGDRVSFNFNCHVGAVDQIIIGDDVLIGSNVLITDHLHGNIRYLNPDLKFVEQPLYSKGPVIIGNNVWLGENVCVMPGVSIGDNCVIGANTVVTKNIPSESVAVGSPAKIICKLRYKS